MFDAYYDRAIDPVCLDCIVRAPVEPVPYSNPATVCSSNVRAEIL